MWSWVLHRITGVSIFFFLLVHTLDTALVRLDPVAYNAVIETYKTPIIGVAELGLVAAILFHALNGVRIILVDFWSKGAKYQRVMFWIVIALAFALFVGFAPRHVIHILEYIQAGK
jgi:succinate dehydrogenase / fumarate reductase cytochrome b subunit